MIPAGYELTEYEHNEQTGVGHFVYEHPHHGTPLYIEAPQPLGPHHAEWDASAVLERAAAQGRDRWEMAYDVLFAAMTAPAKI